MPDMDGIQATWLVSSNVPDGAVIMVTSEERIDFLQKAMSAGAQGYVLKPFGNGEKLLQTVREAHLRVHARRGSVANVATPLPQSLTLGKRIAVVGTKGGVGCTTVATSLALALRRQTQQSVILFDSDVQHGDAGLHLGLTGEHSVLDLIQHIDALDSATLGSVIVKHASGIGLLDRPSQPEMAEAFSSEHVRAIVGALARAHEWIVTDTARFFDERTLGALDVADIQVIVLTGNLGALRNARQFLGLADRLGYPKERMCFVLNRANSTAGLTIEDVAAVVGTQHILQLPSAGAQLTEAVNDGRQLSGNRFSQAIDMLVARVCELSGASVPRVKR